MTSKTYTRSEILAARQTWIDFQSTKGRRKATGKLDTGNGNRCCLGHACHVLKVPMKIENDERLYGVDDDYAETVLPDYVTEQLGMWTYEGDIVSETDTSPQTKILGKYGVGSLVTLNDATDISAVQIGKYLATVIEGGYGTPFRPLSDYPETV